MIDAERIINEEFSQKNPKDLCFPTISIFKFITLLLITFGLYSIIWAYKLWKIIKVDFGYNYINPVLRTFFMGITNFSLFDILNKYIKKYNDKGFPAIIYALIFLICTVTGNFTRYGLFMIIFSIAIITVIQHKLNEINKSFFPTAPINKWNYANTIWTTIFGIIWFLMILGLFVSD